MWSFDQEHMAELPLAAAIASCCPFVRRGKKEKKRQYRAKESNVDCNLAGRK